MADLTIKEATTTAPKYFRAPVATAAPERVERDGGAYGFGLIRGVSVITQGEALGHDLWIDSTFTEQVLCAINGVEGIKARFTHPGMSSDGVGQKLGRLTNAHQVDGQVFADLHLQAAATKTPDGDLADYVMTLAEETPEDFGLSIVFEHDEIAMGEHVKANTSRQNGTDYFVSPDERNSDNYPHARLKRLRAGDVVDSPAANPDGLFQRGQAAAKEGEQLLDYVLGFSDAKPTTSHFNCEADRAKQFAMRYLSRHDIKILKGGDSVADTNTIETEAVELPPTREQFADEMKRYVTLFGAENGTEWFGEGVTFVDAQTRHIEQLSRDIEVLHAKISEMEEFISSIDRGEDDAGEFNATQVPEKQKSLAGKIRIAGKRYDEN